MPRYYIGIDGGSSRSIGLLADNDWRVIHRASAGCANYHLIGLQATEKTLLTLIESLCSAAGLSPKEIEGFCFALSGVSRPRDFKSIESLLRQHLMHKKSKIISDAEAAFLGGTTQEAGLVVISGTGSVVFGRNRSGKTRKVSGHGHLIGDPGSGYDIAIRALRAIIAASEGRAQKTKLTRALLRAISLAEEDDIVPWLHSQDEPKRAIAGLAPTVIAASQEGDKVAGKVVRLAAEDLAALAVFTAEHLGLTSDAFDAVLSGGVFEHNPPYFQLMQSLLTERIPGANPNPPENEPAFGALRALLGRPGSSGRDKPPEHPGANDGLAPPS